MRRYIQEPREIILDELRITSALQVLCGGIGDGNLDEDEPGGIVLDEIDLLLSHEWQRRRR